MTKKQENAKKKYMKAFSNISFYFNKLALDAIRHVM